MKWSESITGWWAEGLSVRIRFHWDSRVLEWDVSPGKPLPPDGDIFMAMTRHGREDWRQWVRPDRLLLIPRPELEAINTDCYRLSDSIRRALSSGRPLGRYAYDKSDPWWIAGSKAESFRSRRTEYALKRDPSESTAWFEPDPLLGWPGAERRTT